MVERRAVRERRRRAKTQRNQALLGIIVLVALFALAFGWRAASERRAAASPLVTKRASARPQVVPVINESQLATPATPIFATYRGKVLRLPVPLADLTEVGFHQASYTYALPLKTKLPDADMGDAKKHKGTGRKITEQDSAPNALLTGAVLRMWRDRPGRPDTAVDVGADPGTKVVSPMTGTIVLVKSYQLYSKYDDYQIHIQPDGLEDVDCVLIHIKDPKVKAGDRVEAGVTQIGVLRKLSDRIGSLQLRSYVKNGGDHTHVQLNDKKDKSYKGLKGAIKLTAQPAE